MTQRNKPASKLLYQAWQRTLPAQSLCLVGSFSLLSSGLVLAQTESGIDNIVPTAANSQPAGNIVKKDIVIQTQAVPTPEAQAQPEFSQRRSQLKQKLRNKVGTSQQTESTRQTQPRSQTANSGAGVRKSKPQVEASQPAVRVRSSQKTAPTITREQKPKVELATPTAPRSTEKLPAVTQPPANNSPSAVGVTPGQPKDYNNALIDPTDYSPNAKPRYEAPSSVVITERSSGCQAVVGQGNGTCARVPVNPSVANAKPGVNQKGSPNWLRRSEVAKLAAVSPAAKPVTKAGSTNTGWRPPRIVSKVISSAAPNTGWRPNRAVSAGATKSVYNANRFIPSPSSFSPTTTVSSVPIAPSAGTLSAPMTAENAAPRPSTVAYNIPLASALPRIAYNAIFGGRVAHNVSGLMYPVSTPSPITSLFGWRIHPITGDRRFHAGMDIGAAMGTPILAAYSGRVENANWMGGYGLTVVLNHNNAQQTLYGHMSQIFVQPGQWVEKGTVIGQVGSTGNSTGPHLHFEVRHLTPQGWVAVDPSPHVQSALNQMENRLNTAQVYKEPGS